MDSLWIILCWINCNSFASYLSTFIVYHVAMEIVAQNRAALYSEHELRNSATPHGYVNSV